MALRANPIEEEWIIIDEDLEKNTKIQGEGKRLTSRDKAELEALDHLSIYTVYVRATAQEHVCSQPITKQ